MRCLRQITWFGLIILGICALPTSAQAQDRREGAERLVKGSVWSGRCNQFQPKEEFAVSITILERTGHRFKADLCINSHHQRYIAGRVEGESIEWDAAPGETDRGGYNVGTIRGRRMEIKFYKSRHDSAEDGKAFYEYQGDGQ